jgi:hypothetical protein
MEYPKDDLLNKFENVSKQFPKLLTAGLNGFCQNYCSTR